MNKQMITLLAFLSLSLAFSCQKEESTVALDNQAIEERNGNPNARVFPPTARPYGKSQAEWAAEWWKHMFSFDCENFPITDEDGSNPGFDLNSPVLFLAGNFDGSTIRTVTVPHGKALFFPIINGAWFYSPCYGSDEEDEAFANGTLEEYIMSIYDPVLGGDGISLSASLDGIAFNNLKDYRFTSGLFDLNTNPDLANCLEDPCLAESNFVSLTDGYWLMLKPLSRGQHTLNFQGGISDFGFSLEVTYHITVE
jgi:hypothetical protein